MIELQDFSQTADTTILYCNILQLYTKYKLRLWLNLEAESTELATQRQTDILRAYLSHYDLTTVRQLILIDIVGNIDLALNVTNLTHLVLKYNAQLTTACNKLLQVLRCNKLEYLELQCNTTLATCELLLATISSLQLTCRLCFIFPSIPLFLELDTTQLQVVAKKYQAVIQQHYLHYKLLYYHDQN